MKKLLLLLYIVSAAAYAQTKEEKEVVAEGSKLYKTEMASWYGTDLFMEKFPSKKDNAGGYFSYLVGNKGVCVFFSRDSSPMIISTITFDSTYNVNTADIDGTDRKPDKRELDLMEIRKIALEKLKTDTLFKFYKDMSPNLIPISDEDGKRVYILTGPANHGIVVFGNDYLLNFDKRGRLKETKRLHKNIITINYDQNKTDKEDVSSMHTHLDETGDLITATDICTLMLYEKFAGWKQHVVISNKKVSFWDCKKNSLFVLDRKVYDKIQEDQAKRHPK